VAVIATPAARVTVAVAVTPVEQRRDARHDSGGLFNGGGSKWDFNEGLQVVIIRWYCCSSSPEMPTEMVFNRYALLAWGRRLLLPA